ncbi:2,5-dichloro-2,5-cyclohexadiene-1,4-diol dehydrogenase [Catellatospora sp. TT07R-123]|uniref:SDR family NAD(P)-dependent oxidoreductase n=1 Tax=Catellatospora sp. TT07R-123 TaxID=2733863 RepID=UPI001B2F5CE2|nr:SDR family oxidoreductase [Catellatospora sp. TT07R-123]GHJ48414.1 2,5-dichloro-2,5-cyclohexadiene-1,4-diol dehydrogenase [Catellatospora sp. TT07R-123]
MMLSGKRVLVFAADERLGGSVARHLARNGAAVWVSGRDEDAVQTLAEKIRADGGEATAASVDPGDRDEVRGHLAEVAATGPIDTVVNVLCLAGTAVGDGVPYHDLDPAALTGALGHVVGAQFLTGAEAARVMLPARRGSIITVATTDGRSGRPHTGALGAIAGALEALTRSMASEYGSSGIRVNHVRTSHSSGPRMYADNALGRAVTADEVAAAITWLACDEAAGVTGQVLEVSGGEHGTTDSVARGRDHHVELDLP